MLVGSKYLDQIRKILIQLLHLEDHQLQKESLVVTKNKKKIGKKQHKSNFMTIIRYQTNKYLNNKNQ
jgi:hypothetical protein